MHNGEVCSAADALRALTALLPPPTPAPGTHHNKSRSMGSPLGKLSSSESWIRRTMPTRHKRPASGIGAVFEGAIQGDSQPHRSSSSPLDPRASDSQRSSETSAELSSRIAALGKAHPMGAHALPGLETAQSLDLDLLRAGQEEGAASTAPAWPLGGDVSNAVVRFTIHPEQITQTVAWNGAMWTDEVWPHVVMPGSVWADMLPAEALRYISPLPRMPEVCVNSWT